MKRTVLALVGLAVAGWLGLTASPAAADPARPTEYRSTVDELDPTNDNVDVEVRGGDAFLEVTVAPGHEVVVEGYQGEPYVQVLADGTVERNRLSPATAINEARFGTDVPPEADPEAEPDWEEVGTGGTYAWHDHRVHWMSPDAPPAEPGEVVFDWTVPLSVDGEDLEVHGTLVRVASVSPVPWVVVAVVVGAALLLAGWRRLGRGAIALAAGATLVAAVVATVLGAAEWTATPASARTIPLLIILPAAAAILAAASLALVAFRPDRADVAGLLAMGSVALLGGWVLVRLTVFWKPVLPSELPSALDRAGVAIALGVAVAAGVALVRATRQLNRGPAPST